MFNAFTIYLAVGLVIGLVACLLLFRKWNLPAYLKKWFRLYTLVKAVSFVLIIGVLLAILISMLVSILPLPLVVSQVIEGVAIGFNCAVLAGVMQPQETKGNASGAKNNSGAKRQDTRHAGRRSRG